VQVLGLLFFWTRAQAIEQAQAKRKPSASKAQAKRKQPIE